MHRIPLLILLVLGVTCGVPIQPLAAGEIASAPLDHLVIAPHPDDETIGCAGVILQALARKERVGVVVLTQGDAHAKLTAVHAGKPEAQLTPEDFVRAGILRQGHVLRAMRRLGLEEGAVVFLGYPDSGLEPMYQSSEDKPFRQRYTGRTETYAGIRADFRTATRGHPAPYTRRSLQDDLAAILADRRPRQVYVTLENDRHPDHRAAAWFVRDALRQAHPAASLYGFMVHGQPPAPEPTLRLSLTSAEHAAKRDALLLHQAGVSPVHDYLAPQFAQSEERFWAVPLR